MPASTITNKNIWIAAGDGDLARVMELIEHQSISPNVPDSFTYTPMHAAASYGHLDVLTYLISKGGNVNVTDEDGDTPLYTIENIETARFLLDHGADPTRRNHEGLTPAETLEEEFPQVAAYLNSVTATDSRAPPENSISIPVDQPSQHSQEAASEHLTSLLMGQLDEIAKREEEAGDEGEREEALRQAVSRAVVESMVTGYTMASGDDLEMQGRDSQNGGVDPTKRRRIDKPDGQL